MRQVGPGRYAIGPAFLVIAGSTYGGLRHDMRPFMKDLSNEIGETIDLAMLDSRRGAVRGPVRRGAAGCAWSRTWARACPLHCTASGKALLAVLEPDEIERELPKTAAGLHAQHGDRPGGAAP